VVEAWESVWADHRMTFHQMAQTYEALSREIEKVTGEGRGIWQAQGNSCYLGNEHSRSCIGVPKG